MKIKFVSSEKTAKILKDHFWDIDYINNDKDLVNLAYSLFNNEQSLIGTSDRTNYGHDEPCMILWARYRDRNYQLVLDSNDLTTVINVFPLTQSLVTMYHHLSLIHI